MKESLAQKDVKSLTLMRRGAAALLTSACIALAPTAVGSLAPVASAHDVVLHSTPADGSTVAAFPRKIVLEFSAIPKDKFNTVAVTNTDTKKVLFTAKPVRNKQYMTIKVPDDVKPGPGPYVVGYQITSSDGHATRGKVSFTVSGSSSSPSAAASAAARSPEANATVKANDQDKAATSTGGPSLGLIVGILALVIVVVGVFVMIRKRK